MVKRNDKILIDYKYLVGISACLRQIDLSIDRCRWTSWGELRAFYKKQTAVEQFFNLFIDICQQLTLHPQYHELAGKVDGFMYITSRFLSFLFRQKSFMTVEELETVYYLLNELENILRNESPNPKYIEFIRLRVANYYTNILLPKLKIKDTKNVLKVEHYLQNESLVTLTLNEIVDR